MSINDAARRYLFRFGHLVFMPVPSATFVGRGRQNARSRFKGLTKPHGGARLVLTEPARDALQGMTAALMQLEEVGSAGTALLFAGCGIDKNKKAVT